MSEWPHSIKQHRGLNNWASLILANINQSIEIVVKSKVSRKSMNPQSDMKLSKPAICPGLIFPFEMITFSWNNKWNCVLWGYLPNSFFTSFNEVHI